MDKEIVYAEREITTADWLRYLDRRLRLLYIEDLRGYCNAREKVDEDIYKMSKGNLKNLTIDMCKRLYRKHVIKPQYSKEEYIKLGLSEESKRQMEKNAKNKASENFLKLNKEEKV